MDGRGPPRGGRGFPDGGRGELAGALDLILCLSMHAQLMLRASVRDKCTQMAVLWGTCTVAGRQGGVQGLPDGGRGEGFRLADLYCMRFDLGSESCRMAEL